MTKIYQFRCTLDCFYAKKIIQELCKLVDIPFDLDKYQKASHNNDDEYGWYESEDPRKVCIFYNHTQKERFIFLECGMGGYFDLAVQCIEIEKDKIQMELTRLYKEALIQEGLNPGDWMLKDVYGTEDDVYRRAVKKYNTDFFV